jgi:hypothetical protein
VCDRRAWFVQCGAVMIGKQLGDEFSAATDAHLAEDRFEMLAQVCADRCIRVAISGLDSPRATA